MNEKSGARTVISVMEDKSQIKFLRSGFRDFARNDNASTNRALNFFKSKRIKKIVPNLPHCDVNSLYFSF